MATVRPLPMKSTGQKAGYDQVDPLVMWFIGGGTAPAATATGIADDDRYGLDLQNSGVGALGLRVIAGTNFGRIDGTGVAFGGTFSHTGTAVFSSLVSVATLTVANGLTVTTGAAIFGGSMSGATTLNIAGAATVGTLRSAEAATMASTLNVLSTADVTGVATFRSTVTVASTFNALATIDVTGVATFRSTVTMASSLNVTGAATVGALHVAGAAIVASNFQALSTLDATGTATFRSTLTVTGAAAFGSTLTVTGATTLVATLNVSGAATVAGLHSVGAATMASTLNVLSTIDVTGAATFRSTVTMASTLAVSGAITSGGDTVAKIKVGTYTGNGGGSIGVTGVGFSPLIVFVNDPTGLTGGWFNVGNQAITPTSGGATGNTATNLDADGFTINSTVLNVSSRTYYYVAIG